MAIRRRCVCRSIPRRKRGGADRTGDDRHAARFTFSLLDFLSILIASVPRPPTSTSPKVIRGVDLPSAFSAIEPSSRRSASNRSRTAPRTRAPRAAATASKPSPKLMPFLIERVDGDRSPRTAPCGPPLAMCHDPQLGRPSDGRDAEVLHAVHPVLEKGGPCGSRRAVPSTVRRVLGIVQA